MSTKFSRGSSLSFLAIMAVAGGIASNAKATLIAYEPFNYGTGTSLSASSTPTPGTGFTSFSTVVGTNTIVSGLTYPSLSTSGNAIDLNYPGYGNQTQITEQMPTSYSYPLFVSFLLNMSTVTTGDEAVLQMYPSNYPGASIGIGIDGQNNSGSENLGVGYYGGYPSGPFADSSVTAVANTTYLLVGELDGTNVTMWVDPTPGTVTPPAGGVSIAWNLGAPGAYPFGAYRLFVDNQAGDYRFDEVRIGTTFADVVPSSAPIPEPVSIGLLAMSSIFMLRRRSRA
jgi:hypothetical protein